MPKLIILIHAIPGWGAKTVMGNTRSRFLYFPTLFVGKIHRPGIRKIL